MTPVPAEDAPPSNPLYHGTVRWFDSTRRMGVIARPDGTTIFVPPYGLAEGQASLATGQQVTFVERANAKGPFAAEVRVTDDIASAPSDVAAQIAQALGETAPPALAQIRRIVRTIGPEAAQATVDEALQVEVAGGMLVPDGSRRRTLGGVFFALVRDRLPPEQREIVFPPRVQWRKPRSTREPTAEAPISAPQPPPMTWDDRPALIAALRQESGKATTVKMTIIGRPRRVEEQPQFTLLTLDYSGPLPALPKGIPAPATVPTTTYAVYIGKKQWKQVAEALQNEEDVLIVEGTPVADAETGTISVFATKTTTKLLQQGNRQPKPQDASTPESPAS
ncbi:MAG: cold shock domain-containing protein [Chloroflexales bacterium]|nr:cold shock domain-containing protein [Chloroflexales bacterium]